MMINIKCLRIQHVIIRRVAVAVAVVVVVVVIAVVVVAVAR